MENFEDRQTLTRLYAGRFGTDPAAIEPIKQAGSTRRYYRITGCGDPVSVVGTVGNGLTENRAFIALTRHFSSRSLPVPEILAVSDDSSAYLQTDNGDRSLYDLIVEAKAAATFPASLMPMLEQALAGLASMQTAGAEGLDWSVCYPVGFMNRRAVMWDLSYFKYDFLKVLGVEFDESGLEDDFERMADELTADNVMNTFQFRDFQSRNIMVDRDGRLTFIDYQSGRRGTPFYDAASFIWQSRAGFDADTRRYLAEVYRNELNRHLAPDKRIGEEDFDRRYRLCVLFRTLQTLGAYGLRGLVERKAMFISSIPGACANVVDILAEGISDYPAIAAALKNAVVRCREAVAVPTESESGNLTLTVGSFSYKKGYPLDATGNGGGFVFDCRWMKNPGRFERYRRSTGRDADVIEFLVEAGECDRFIDDCLNLVRPAVERYIDRGFSHLCVWFGCTGGQHRSVYCAEGLSRRLASIFGPSVEIDLHHREQHIRELIKQDRP